MNGKILPQFTASLHNGKNVTGSFRETVIGSVCWVITGIGINNQVSVLVSYSRSNTTL